ncbi:phosphoethanolamine transferase [Escherichia coli]|uniref:Phosphoethanolamine transferase n=1 Tax=Escherichia coli TaxID=562 RepID=A0A2X1KRA9_ECOLX|nr:phosphoethanolamine transferase [Escherichia coli]
MARFFTAASAAMRTILPSGKAFLLLLNWPPPVLVTFFLLRLLSLFGRRSWRILASLVVLFSAGASYYMTFLNVVIGYGIIASVMTTDIDLSKEVVGLNFILWLIAVSALPLILIWNNRCRYTLLRQLRTPGQRIRSLAVVVLAVLWLGTDSFAGYPAEESGEGDRR